MKLALLMLVLTADSEANDRFKHGLHLYSAGDKAAALIEFQRVYELMPKASVLYNIGMTWAGLDAPVKAVDAFDKVLASPEGVPVEYLERAKKMRAEQAAKLGELIIELPVAGASVDVNDETVGVSPLPGPVKVRAGKAMVVAVAPKHAPKRIEALVPAGERVTVPMELVRIDKSLAQLRVRTRTIGADVFVDGERVGVTPLSATVAVASGERRVVLSREGYVTREQVVSLGEGSFGEVSLDLDSDPAALERDGAMLELTATETQVVVSVDGETGKKYDAPLKLMAGPHRVVVERDGFYTVTRDVRLAARGTTTLDVTFEPTAKTLAELEATYLQRRVFGIASGALGVAIIAGSIGYLVYNVVASDGLFQREMDLLAGRIPECMRDNNCEALAKAANEERQRAVGNRLISYIGIPLGVILTGTATFLMMTAPDPHRYDRPVDTDLSPRLAFEVGPTGVTLAGRF